MGQDNRFSQIESLTLASSIGSESAWLNSEQEKQLQTLRPIASILVKTALIDYLEKPNYDTIPPTKRSVELNASRTIRSLLTNPDTSKGILIDGGLNRKRAEMLVDVREHMRAAKLTDQDVITLNQDDIDALLCINPTSQGDRSIARSTAMSSAMSKMWKLSLYDPKMVTGDAKDFHDKILAEIYRDIHQHISKRLEVKKSLLQQSRAIRHKPELQSTVNNELKERADFILADWGKTDNKSRTYKGIVQAGQIMFMVNKLAVVNPTALANTITTILRGTTVDIPPRESDQQLFIKQLKEILRNAIYLQLEENQLVQSPTIDLSSILDAISLDYIEEYTPDPSELNIIENFQPSNPKSTQLTEVERLGLSIVSHESV